jgi:beta-N-acetylhexosaminidase
VITGLLREELGYDGVVITDALEMQGVARVADLPEAAVRALQAGADALCLGSWSFGDDVRTAVAAISEAVANGRLERSRLEAAAQRLQRMGHREPTAGGELRPGFGLDLARRAVEVSGDVRLHGTATLVLRLEPGVSPAAGRGHGDLEGDLERRGQQVERVAVSGETYNGEGMVHAAIGEFTEEYGRDGEVVVVVRSPHRYEWMMRVLDRVLADHPDVVVVDMGFVHRDFSSARGWLRTYGGAQVCATAAAELLVPGRR